MKGIILAGGFGTRLHPVTKAINKHLIPVFNKPMIYYPLEILINSGINKIQLITTPLDISLFVRLLGSGEEFREKYGRPIQITYAIQPEPTGIADGLRIAKDYIGTEDCALILGDNIFENANEIKEGIKNFKTGATIFVKEVEDPHRFGIAEVDSKGTVISIEEKPNQPRSKLAVTGVYIYDNTCFEKCQKQEKSERGEYEITDINNLYREENKLSAKTIKGKRFDTGTHSSLLEASIFMSSKETYANKNNINSDK